MNTFLIVLIACVAGWLICGLIAIAFMCELRLTYIGKYRLHVPRFDFHVEYSKFAPLVMIMAIKDRREKVAEEKRREWERLNPIHGPQPKPTP
jgi:hypothetical protein